MDLNRAIEFALDGEAILFTGAGFGLGARNISGGSLKSGAALAAHFSKKIQAPLQSSLEDASEEYANKFGDDKLIEELQNEYLVKDVTKAHLTLSKIPWKRIYTTNYDNLLETSYGLVSKKLIPITITENISKLPPSNVVCVHLNGYVPNISRDNIWSEVKLTDTSYISSSIAQSPWCMLFRQDLRIARSIFFIGYSAYDLDIKRILFEDPDIVRKTFFVIGKNPKPLTVRKVNRFGTAIEKDTDDLAEIVEKKSNTYSPPTEVPFLGHCVERFLIPSSHVKISDQNIFDLIMYGKSESNFIWSSLNFETRYYCIRNEIALALNQLRNGKKLLAIHSNVGNGKTLFLEGFCCKAHELGYSIFFVTDKLGDVISEIDQIIKIEEKCLLVVDNYPDRLETVEYFYKRASGDSAAIIAARSSAHEVLIDHLSKSLGIEDVFELQIDQLSSEEITWVQKFLDEYGLWGEKASWDKIRKIKFLKTTCKSEFHAILLKVFEAPQIINKFDKIIRQITDQKDYYEILIGILALSMINYRIDLSSLIDIWGDKVLGSQFRRNEIVNLLIDFDRAIVKIKSAVAAEYILRKVANAHTVVEVLTQIFRSFERAARTNKQCRNILSALCRFKNIQFMLPDKSKRAACIKYYESLKSMSYCRKNPLFWFQYAISCLVFKDFERSEMYFKTAYSFAKKTNFNTFQIDNHFARFCIEKAINAGDYDSCMSLFRKARRIINNQAKVEKLHYPYRVAIGYQDFYETFEEKLSSDEKAEIGRAAKYILNSILKLPPNKQERKYIKDCKEAMELLTNAILGSV